MINDMFSIECGMMRNLPEYHSGALGPKVEKRIVFGPFNKTWERNVMRFFTFIEAGYETKPHIHEWSHKIVGIEGQGVITCDDESFLLNAGGFIYIPPMAEHTYRSNTDKWSFVCVVPLLGDPETEGMADEDCEL